MDLIFDNSEQNNGKEDAMKVAELMSGRRIAESIFL